MARVAKSQASRRVMGPDLDPDEITRWLGCAPDLAYARGDVLDRGRVSERLARKGLWSIRAGAREPSDLDASVAELLARTTSDLGVWATIRARHRLDVFGGLFLHQLNEGLTISAASLLALGERGIELGLDVYAPMQEASFDD